MGKEKLERDKMPNNVEQDTETHLSNGSESGSVYEGSSKRKPLQRRKHNIKTEEENSEQQENLEQAMRWDLLPVGIIKTSKKINIITCLKTIN